MNAPNPILAEQTRPDSSARLLEPSFKDQLLVLRFARLGKMPPALYATQILSESGIPTILFEFDPETARTAKDEKDAYTRVRLALKYLDPFPSAIRSPALLLIPFLYLAKRIARSGRPKLIVAHGPFEQTLAWLLHLFFRVPYAVHVHEISEESGLPKFMTALAFLETFALRAAKFTIFPEKNRAEIYRKRCGLTAPIHIAYNCPRLRRSHSQIDLKAKLGLPKDSFLILYIGGIDSTNALEHLVGSLPRVRDTVHVLIVGWGTDAFRSRLKEIAQARGCANRLHLMGMVEDKWEIIDSVDAAFCVYQPNALRTVHLATASNKMTEAISSGVPVIVRHSEDFQEFLSQYPVGVACSEISEGGIADAINRLDSDPELREELRKRALRFHATDLNYETQFAIVLESFQKYFR